MSENKESFIVKKLKGNNDDVNREIKLIANTGVQFLDFEFDAEIDFEKDESIPSYIKTGQFARVMDLGNHYARFRPDDSLSKLIIPNSSIQIGIRETYSLEKPLSMIDSLNLYNGVYFPIPYFSKNSSNAPSNWVRARIINLNDAKKRENGGRYHVTFAFDTRIDNSNSALHCAPTSADVNNSFCFRGGIEATAMLNNNEDGTSYVREWAKSVYKDIFALRSNEDSKVSVIREWTDDNTPLFEKHYLNVLAFIEHFVKPNDIKLIHFDQYHTGANAAIDVSLILDIGNSRSCGLLVEDNKLATQNSSAFLTNCPLELRDLNAPEHIYSGAFESRIEFQRANFDYNFCSDISSRLDAFVWPSLVRVGPEAAHLSSLVKSDEGNTGLNSPKRYLWQIKNEALISEWRFNNSYYQIEVLRQDENDRLYVEYKKNNEANPPATYYPVSQYLNSLGDALFASTGDTSKLKANYSGKSTMTFMLMELILQAMMQMNSYGYRCKKGSNDCPRRLKSIVLTTPPSMPEIEREIFRSCAYQALGVIWKAYGYDSSAPDEFKFIKNAKAMFPQVPEVILKWDETFAGQMVYLYNETQKIYNENCKDFLKQLRRKDAKFNSAKDRSGRFDEVCADRVSGYDISSSASARIASIDIGGGTTDLVIADYSFPDKRVDDEGREFEIGNQSAVMQIRQILREGFKIAGDDLLLDIIKKHILPQIGTETQRSAIVGRSSDQDVKNRKNRVQSVEQIFAKIGYRILNRLESLEFAPRGTTDIKVEGTVLDFLCGRDKCNVDLSAPFELALEEETDDFISEKDLISNDVKNYIKEKSGIADIGSIRLSFDLYRLNHSIAAGFDYDICKCINRLNALVNAYQCDALLLTGRVSKIPGIRSLIERKSALSSRRIVSMHKYKCGSWYPAYVSKGGRINDPKSTVVVGALLGYIKLTDATRLINFRINSDPLVSASPCRFLGALNSDRLEDNEILYRYCTKAERLDYDHASSPDDDYNRNKVFTDPKNTQMVQITEYVNNNNETEIYARRFVKTFPINIGYRQFENPEYPATMLYTLSPYKNVSDVPVVRATRDIIIPEASKISFSDEGLQLLKDELISKLNVECQNQALEAYSEAKSEYERALNSDYSNQKIPFEEQAKVYAENESAAVKKGLFGNRKEAAYNEAYSRYMQEHAIDIECLMNQAREDAKKKVLNMFIIKLCRIVDSSIKSVREKAENDLIRVTNDVTRSSHSFQFQIEMKPIADVQNNAVADCLKFMQLEMEENYPSVSVFSLKEVTNKSKKDGGSEDIHDYLNLSLMTVTPDAEEYWKNTGILLKD